MPDLYRPKRALISVSEKTGIEDFARSSAQRNIELLSTGGTANLLRNSGLDVTDVSKLTGFPEMMDGRVKTLHPAVHGGLLALRDNPEHVESMDKHGIKDIDILVVNLYPFEKTVAAGADYDVAIENIDIGGPAMIRAAAKNHGFVTVITDPEDYQPMLSELDANDGATALDFRKLQAQIAYGRTAAYDAAVSTWMASAIGQDTPRRRVFSGHLAAKMRYGENPHQVASFYKDGTNRAGVATAQIVQGKALSYNNINDTDAAFELVAEFGSDKPACAIIKHANPCGVARAETLFEAYNAAYDCDRTSAFGGIIALNQPLDVKTAKAITQIFTEVVIAPGADDEAISLFSEKKNLRLLLTDDLPNPADRRMSFKPVSGGFLVQDIDNDASDRNRMKVVTDRAPTEQELEDLLFAEKVAKHVKSNAIVYAKNGATVGIGAGQMSRIDSTRIAAQKAMDIAEVLELASAPTIGSVVASDAFFPFADGLITAAQAGATAVIQPGGSMRDAEVIAAANEAGLAMVFTNLRHFRH